MSDYDIVDATPYKKDPMRALADEAKKQGLQVRLLLLDHGLAPPVAVREGAPARTRPPATSKTEMREGRSRSYVAYMKAQLKELITKYDPAILWFDGEWVRLVDRGGRQGSLSTTSAG